MKIDLSLTAANHHLDRATTGKSTSPARSENLGQTEQAAVSADFGKAATLKAALDQTPEVRQDRVAALRAQIQQGTYKVSNEDIAGAMLTDLGVGEVK